MKHSRQGSRKTLASLLLGGLCLFSRACTRSFRSRARLFSRARTRLFRSGAGLLGGARTRLFRSGAGLLGELVRKALASLLLGGGCLFRARTRLFRSGERTRLFRSGAGLLGELVRKALACGLFGGGCLFRARTRLFRSNEGLFSRACTRLFQGGEGLFRGGCLLGGAGLLGGARTRLFQSGVGLLGELVRKALASLLLGGGCLFRARTRLFRSGAGLFGGAGLWGGACTRLFQGGAGLWGELVRKGGVCGLVCGLFICCFSVVLKGEESAFHRGAWEARSGREALRAGLFSLAEPLLLKALGRAELVGQRDALHLDLADLAIAVGNYQDAWKWLDAIEARHLPAWKLRQAFLSWQRADRLVFFEQLGAVEEAGLSQEVLPWFYFLHFVRAYHLDSDVEAHQHLQRAYREAEKAGHRARFELLALREKFLAKKEDGQLALKLEEQLEKARGGKRYVEFLAYLATVEFRLGKEAKALKRLRDYRLLHPRGVPASLLLLEGFITPDALEAQELYALVLDGPVSNKSHFLALAFIAGDLEKGQEVLLNSFKGRLSVWLQKDWEDAFYQRLLLIEVYLRIEAGDWQAARKHLNALVETLPAGELLSCVLWARAYLSYGQKRYRLAADDLSRLRSGVADKQEALALGSLMGDCYYLNTDYTTAGDLYLSLSKNVEPFDGAAGSVLLYRALLAYLKADEASRALSVFKAMGHLDNQRFFWKSKEVLVAYLAREGQLDRALEYLNQGGDVPAEFEDSFNWLRGRLQFAKGHYEEAISSIAGLLKRESSGLLEVQTASAVLLLYARSLLYLDKIEASLTWMKKLRERYEGSDAAIFSYLEEAHYAASQFKLDESVAKLRRLGDLYPRSPYAPVALYEAAILANRQGLDTGRREAISILNLLIEKYPDHELIFSSKLLRGNITRSLGQFDIAESLFKALIKEYPKHPEVYLAELYRANAFLAFKHVEQGRLVEVASALENVRKNDEVPHSARVEASYVLATIFVRLGKEEEAEGALWVAVSTFQLREHAEEHLGVKGRYWMARCLLMLGHLLEGREKWQEAVRVYKILAQGNLPGKEIVKARIEKMEELP